MLKESSYEYRLNYLDKSILQYKLSHGERLPEHTKLKLASKIAFILEHGSLPQERIFLKEELKRIIFDGDTEYRIQVSKLLSGYSNLPQEIIARLISDKPEVAMYILKYSESLNEKDLLNVIRNDGNYKRLLAIAKRKTLDPAITASLIEKGDRDLVLEILLNKNVKFSVFGAYRLIERYADDQECMNILLDRNLIPNPVKDELKARFSGNNDDLHKTTKQFETTRLLHLDINSGAKEEMLLRTKLDALYEKQQITPMLLIHTLCKGDIFSFVYGLAKTTGLPFISVKASLCNHHNYNEFRKLCMSADIPPDLIIPLHNVTALILEKDKKLSQENFSEIIYEEMLKTENSIKKFGLLSKFIKR